MSISSDDHLSLTQLIERVANSGKPDDVQFAAALQSYMRTADPSCAEGLASFPSAELIEAIGKRVGSTISWSEREERIGEFAALILAKNPLRIGTPGNQLLQALVKEVCTRERDGRPVDVEKFDATVIRAGLQASLLASLAGISFYVGFTFWPWLPKWKEQAGRLIYPSTLEKFILALDRPKLIEAINSISGREQNLLEVVAATRLEDARAWLSQSVANRGSSVFQWQLNALVRGNAAFYADALGFLKQQVDPVIQANVLFTLIETRGIDAEPEYAAFASRPEIAASQELNELLAEVAPDLLVRVFPQIIAGNHIRTHNISSASYYVKGYEVAAERLLKGGDKVFVALAQQQDPFAKSIGLRALLALPSDTAKEPVIELTLQMLSTSKAGPEADMLHGQMVEARPEWFVPQWWELLGSSSKQARARAVDGLVKAVGAAALWPAVERLSARQSDTRLGAVALLAKINDPKVTAALTAALETEKSAQVRAAIRDALAAKGVSPAVDQAAVEGPSAPVGFPELERQLATQKRVPKVPAAWLDLTTLPGLYALGSEQPLSERVVLHLVATQASHKAISLSPELASVWLQIDRARSGDFALAVLNAWLVSPQDAKDRWALAIAGLLGDARILSVLNSWIPKWCEASRHKLAEYAAQAIALQGSDPALMLLDALATRYRSKFRNIGAAAAQSFQDAATMRGLSADELGDRVVPTFGFDENGERVFTWEGGSTRAELSVDLKVTWADPESDKTLKALPASAPDELKTEAKELGKLLREAAKSQTARLELALVRQRRWPVKRWRELYQTHPVLRAYATRLVWGVYAEDGALLRCFRRYPNGLLADAVGGLEELLETDTTIGMVHPLELTAETIVAWRGHLGRFKITPPFPQLERAVERLDAQHVNRRELAVAKGRAIGSGTFRSRAERRGWSRGSVIDGGCVSNYYKLFPGAGVEVYLELEGMYVGIDPTEMVTLGVARFAKTGSVVRGSYTYDEPQAGDARVVAFGDVPAVVYSETVADLKAIAGLVADPTAKINAGETSDA